MRFLVRVVRSSLFAQLVDLMNIRDSSPLSNPIERTYSPEILPVPLEADPLLYRMQLGKLVRRMDEPEAGWIHVGGQPGRRIPTTGGQAMSPTQ